MRPTRCLLSLSQRNTQTQKTEAEKPSPPFAKNHKPKNQKTNQQEFEGRIAYYPYMRMRQRAEYPWGGPNGLFEPHPRIVPDGEEPAEHH